MPAVAHSTIPSCLIRTSQPCFMLSARPQARMMLVCSPVGYAVLMAVHVVGACANVDPPLCD